MASKSALLDLSMQFVDIISKTQEQDLQFYFGFSSEQKSLELIVVFQNPKSTFYLNGSVHTIQDACFAHDIFVRLLSFTYKVFGYIQPFISFCLCTFIFVRASAAVCAFIYGHI